MGKGKKILKTAAIILIVLAVLVLSFTVYMSLEIKGEPSKSIFNESDVFESADISSLIKEEGKDFQILLFSDIQLSGNIISDQKALKLVDQLVQEINPDFIMTTGDNAMMPFSDIVTKKLISQMESYQIPWGVTFGNHDSEGRPDRTWFGNQYENAAYSLFKAGPSNIQGIGNYVINIVNKKSDPIYSLIMMDSNTNRVYEDGKDYDYIYDNQISWYEWVVKGQPEVPSMLFFHIPLPEFKQAVSQWENGEIDRSSGFGENHEDVFCAPVNTGFFDKIKTLDSTTHMFNGHDHINSLSVLFEGIRMTYGLKTGPCSYSEKEMQGATLITIKDGTNEVIVEHLYR
ncbi:MAG: metallophosphoesterase [Clostridia bacterium]|nr:metallophosphoesterase [Clostridia bacterium]